MCGALNPEKAENREMVFVGVGVYFESTHSKIEKKREEYDVIKIPSVT